MPLRPLRPRLPLFPNQLDRIYTVWREAGIDQAALSAFKVIPGINWQRFKAATSRRHGEAEFVAGPDAEGASDILGQEDPRRFVQGQNRFHAMKMAYAYPLDAG